MIRKKPIFTEFTPPREQVQNPITGVMEERRLTYDEIIQCEAADLQNFFFHQANFEPYDLSHIIRTMDERVKLLKKLNKRRYVAHGSSKNPLYKQWASMKYNDKKGGTSLCQAWAEDFQVYLKWALSEGGWVRGEATYLIRRDGREGFTPANCRFGTLKESNLARRGRIVSTNTSGHVGIFQVKKTGKWLCNINMPDGLHKLGSFDSKQAAIDAKEAWLRGD